MNLSRLFPLLANRSSTPPRARSEQAFDEHQLIVPLDLRTMAWPARRRSAQGYGSEPEDLAQEKSPIRVNEPASVSNTAKGNMYAGPCRAGIAANSLKWKVIEKWGFGSKC